MRQNVEDLILLDKWKMWIFDIDIIKRTFLADFYYTVSFRNLVHDHIL